MPTWAALRMTMLASKYRTGTIDQTQVCGVECNCVMDTRTRVLQNGCYCVKYGKQLLAPKSAGFVLCSAAVLYVALTAVACVPVQDSYYSQTTGFVHTR